MFIFNRLIGLLKLRVLPRVTEASERATTTLLKSKLASLEANGHSKVLIEGMLRTPKNNVEKIIIAAALKLHGFDGFDVILKHSFLPSDRNYFFYRTLGAKRFFSLENAFLNPIVILLSLAKTINLFLIVKNKDDILNVKVKGVCIGDLIYDSIIRENEKVYTVEKLAVTRDFFLVFKSFCFYFYYDRVLSLGDYRYLITSHKTYVQYGILCKVAKFKGCDVILKDMNLFKNYKKDIDIEEHIMKPSVDDFSSCIKDKRHISESRKYINDRFSGAANDMDIDVLTAFVGKKTYTKEMLLDFFSINNKKKLCFIMPHAFSDSPHVGTEMIFSDYYDWLVATLESISRNNNFNIFIKPHPTSYCWGEDGVVESILKKNKITNVYIVPDDFNTNSVPFVADLVITCQGTIALEAVSFGVPSYTCASGYYGGFGITKQFTNKENYINHISTMKNIESVDSEKMISASCLLYLEIASRIYSSAVPFEDILPVDDFDIRAKKLWSDIFCLLNSYEFESDPLVKRIKESIH